MRDASFFAFASKSLAPAFTHAFKGDGDLSPYAHLPFLACLLQSQIPTEALFLDSSRSLAEWTTEFIVAESLPTAVHATDAAGETPPSWDKIALLHIDATTPASLIEERLDRWMPRLREDGALLIYGVETPRGAALWRRLSAKSASFLLTGGPGLGLLAPRSIPPALTCLLGAPGQRLSDDALTRLKYHFSALGETAANRAGRDSAMAAAQARENAARDTRIRLTEMTAALRTSQEREDAASRLEAKLADVEARLARSTEALERTRRRVAEQQELLEAARIWMEQAFPLLTSQSTATAELSRQLSSHEEALTVLRSFLEAPTGLVRRFARAVLHPDFSPFVPTTPEPPRLALCAPPPTIPAWRDEPPPQEITSTSPTQETLGTEILIEAPSLAQRLIPASARQRNVLFVSGEPTTPGTIYRCQRNAAACAAAGHVTRVCDCAAVGPDEVAWADVLILWRVVYSEHVNILIRLAHERGAIVVFDVDDLVFIPALANISVIDGIRTIGVTESETNSLFAGFGVTLNRSDACIGTTDTLAHHMRRLKPLTYTLPNIFDHSCLAKSRLAVRHRAWEGADGLVRIGYASGTRTHQRDFALVADVLARLLYQRPELRLVLFREPGNHKPILLMDEFPALASVAAQIEWRDTVPLADLPMEFARFDISIAPLETGNVFCEAKSEIKFLEAALAGVPSIVSPTAPYRATVVEGVTGLMADTPDEWDQALRRLLDDAPLRSRMARDAFNHLLWNFGPERQALLFETIIMSLGDEVAAARATETMLARGSYRSRNLPEIPESQTLFIHDALGEAQVTVLITSHNYGDLIVEALESVRAQTMRTLDLIVVDDVSEDDSAAVVLQWARRHAGRFNRLLVLAPYRNVGLGGARNIGVSASETPFFLSLDADNRLLPDACEALLEACVDAAYAYPSIRTFGEGHSSKIMGDLPSRPLGLAGENYIDAMAMVAKWAWAAAGGYYVSREAMGWEDFDLWCSLAEMGLRGARLARVAAEYRMHDASMTSSVTERSAHKARVVAYIKARHPWVDVHHEAFARA
ncbi:glycosyltransferase [Acetobacter sacchari]|uniref:Glycosyltransferase n=1 Tax=Acetobacter sacchari TaxID=2661687 RepID=A0ABS3LS17_9PROT|nr:glycosyltransferase [Acetobacter sacchari]MBO1358696.1 glycosyltransferase [Acetobacter sacchari]